MENENYTISFEKDEKSFPYNQCQFQDIRLKRYHELPQRGTWSEPRFAMNRELIGAKFTPNNKDNETETVYIWSVDDENIGKKPLYEYTHSKILAYDFSPSSTSFVIVYKRKPPVHYNVKSGHKICDLETKNIQINSALAWCFSPQGRFFALATEDHFFVWDVLTSKLKFNFEESSPKKYIRNNILITINKDKIMNLINFSENKTIAKFEITNISNYNEILACMLTQDNSVVYYAISKGVYKLNIEDKEIEEVLYFENHIPKKVFISNDCKKYCTTDYISFCFWEEKKGLNMNIPRQEFNDISVSIDSSLLLIVDNISITFQDLSTFSQEKDLFKVFTDINPTKFEWIQFSVNSLYILCLINDNSAALYNCSTGQIVHKWYNDTPNWRRALQLVPITASPTVLATKTSECLIEIWDYSKGIPVVPLKGFNAYDLKFNDSGNLLIAGTVGGSEVARIWDIDYPQKPFIYKTSDGSKNKNTVVYLTEDKLNLICHSCNQDPIIFDSKTAQIIYKLDCEFKFSYIENIICSELGEFFISYGDSTDSTLKIAVLWNFRKGQKMKILDKCSLAQISENGKAFIHKYEGRTKVDSKLTLWDIGGNGNLTSFEISNISANDYRILNDSRTFIMCYENLEKNEYKYTLHDIRKGEMYGEILYAQKDKEYSNMDLFIDTDDNVILRRVMFE